MVAIKSYNIIPDSVTVIPCTNPYKPITNVINPNIKRKIEETIEKSVIKADKVIIAQATGIYANLAIKFCKKYRKKYLVIVGKCVQIKPDVELATMKTNYMVVFGVRLH